MEQQIKQLLLAEFADAQLELALDGNRANIDICHEKFADLSRVKRQQAVYACINELITSGELHAVTIVTRVPD